jgi:hypothetical protein
VLDSLFPSKGAPVIRARTQPAFGGQLHLRHYLKDANGFDFAHQGRKLLSLFVTATPVVTKNRCVLLPFVAFA